MESIKKSTTDKPCIAIIAISEEHAVFLAKKLVESRVAACVSIFKDVKSIYIWEGETKEDTEDILIAKSFLSLKEKFKSLVLENHPYDTPEIIFLKIEDVEAKYLYWMKEVLMV
jgi:uncharacterized protein involved in tolerance to divalent cations